MQVGATPVDGSAIKLIGRRDEVAVLDGFVAALIAGESRALLLRGEPGVGKTALLDYLVTAATPHCRVLRCAGVQAEMELAFASLHQLSMPLREYTERLPEVQRTALTIALGEATGPAPDRFLVGLAVLNLMSFAATERPLLCVVDDVQWLDQASAQVLTFVARRLVAEAVGVAFGSRPSSTAVSGLPTLVITGLAANDAHTLLTATLTAPMDERVRNQIVAETRGNPLALLELPRSMSTYQLAAGPGFRDSSPMVPDVEESFRARIETLPKDSRRLLLLAAAEPTGSAGLLWRAADLLDIARDASIPALDAGLCEFEPKVRFRHPLVRSAAYRAASVREHQQVHRALAEATDRDIDPDRRAWHYANAATGPDNEVAGELERSADRARARGGPAAAAAFLERAAALTSTPELRSDRALAAASEKASAGAFDDALELLSSLESEALTGIQRARADVTRARVAFIARHGSDAPPLLLKAAQQLATVDRAASQGVFLDAIFAAMFAGKFAVGASAIEVAAAASLTVDGIENGGPTELLLSWLVAHHLHGYAASVPGVRAVMESFKSNPTAWEDLRLLMIASTASLFAWDDSSLDALTRRHVGLTREIGATSEIPLALSSWVNAQIYLGDVADAASVIAELNAATEATGVSLAPYAAVCIAAMRGDRDEALRLIEGTVAESAARGEGNGVTNARWLEAQLHNAFGDYKRALAAARQAAEFPPELGATQWVLPELVEAAVRQGETTQAQAAADRLGVIATAIGSDWALGLSMRSHGLLSDGDTADRYYRSSLEHLGRTRVRVELARTHLVYGEWLRRERRRGESRTQLRAALELFVELGRGAFAERTRRELNALGDVVGRPVPRAGDTQLTAQETQVAQLARAGLSNPEIGARLYISARTVQYHLGKVFTKLGITSRTQLDRVLP